MQKSASASRLKLRPAEDQGDPTTSNLAGKATITVFSRATAIVLQMSAIVVLTRILPKERFGLLTFVLLAYATVITVSQLGIPDSIFYFFERVTQSSRKSLALLLGRMLFLIGLGGSSILVLLTFLAPVWGFEVGGLFLPLLFLALLELPTLALPNILVALDRAKTSAWMNIVFSLIYFAAVVVPASLGQSLLTIMFCLLGYGIVRFVGSSLVFFKTFPEERDPLPHEMAIKILKYSVPLGLAQVLWGVNRQIDKYVIAALFPATVLAEYAIGAWEIPIIPTIAYSVALVMMPRFVSCYLNGRKEELLSLWFAAIKKVAVVVLPLTILFLIIAEEFIVLFFSENYIAAVVPFRIYTIILLQRVAAYSAMHRALGNSKVISYAAFYLLAINVILTVPFALWLGIAGPPLATLAANIFAWWYTMNKMRLTLNVSWRTVFPFGFYGRTFLACVLAGVPALLLKINFEASVPVELVSLVLCYLVAYSIVSSLIGVVKKEDWRHAGRLLGFKSAPHQ